ncbi:ABC transporter substrate-binding protein [Catellatospora sp. KI3]|uniref:ABC transporter substrate-binding protein n=1 Tax=Catellatospora sp. KI3 TaxID=3041620 RepID=UPI002482BF6C|nr:ABC transporter substrate-binding protein [Catellatospora sp. KI3]MDI1461831.1 ABC transporter substrate-binding protein [Catellatospora sp. KI3]
MRISRAVAAAACVSLLTLAACSNKADDPRAAEYLGAYLYGTDGNMSNEFGDIFADHPGVLAGMKGTLPLTPLDAVFVGKLKAIDPTLKDFTYAGETYDAVIISALAAQQAGSTKATDIAKYINGVTTDGAVCKTVAQCLQAARKGDNIAYRGVTVKYGFTDAGEPSTTTYATLHFDTTNQVDSGKTEYLGTGNESDVTSKDLPRGAANAKSSTPLTIGGLLPRTGALSFITKPMDAGAALAIAEINAAGGVLGKDVKWIDGNDGTDPKVARQTIASHHANGVQILIGTGASGVALASLPDAVKNNMIMFSPSNTSASLTTADDQGLYFRTAPSDILQARAIADVMLRDGDRKIAIIAHAANYGTKLTEDVKKELVKAGLSETDIHAYTYQINDDGTVKDKAELATIAKEVAPLKADGVLIIGYAESAEAIKALVDAGATIRH